MSSLGVGLVVPSHVSLLIDLLFSVSVGFCLLILLGLLRWLFWVMGLGLIEGDLMKGIGLWLVVLVVVVLVVLVVVVLIVLVVVYELVKIGLFLLLGSGLIAIFMFDLI